MQKNETHPRRSFLKSTGLLAAGIISAPLIGHGKETTGRIPVAEGLYQIGPKEGYSLHIGTLLSTMTMMRTWIVRGVQNLTVEQLDFQIDEQSNSIGAMLLHLAATERYYQLNTFEGLDWGSWDEEIKKEWDVPMGLGAAGREQIKGHSIEYYLEKLAEVRKMTEEGFAKRDDDWLMESEPFFDNQPTNNYAKWFHVCEHESNHNGQIKFLKKRMPS